MEEDIGQKEFVINEIFEPLFYDFLGQPKYCQVYGGRGSGKSTAVAVASVELTYSEFEHNVLYIRQTQASIEDSSIADVRQAIKDLGYEDDFVEKGGKIFNKTTGSTIAFKGIRTSGSATAKLKSLSGITIVVFEEAEEVESFEEWSKVDEGIRKKGVPLKNIMVYNPSSALSSWVHEEWFIDGKPNDARRDDTVFMHSTYLDNLENLNEKTIESYERLKETNPVYYKNTILAEWTLDAQERIYSDWELIPRMKEEGDTWYGLDFGYGGKDHTACVKVTWVDGVYYVKEMFSEPKQKIRDTYDSLVKCGISKNAKIFADYAVPLLITELKLKGFAGIQKCKKGKVESEVKKIQDLDIRIIGNKDSNLYFHNKTWQKTKGKIKEHEPDCLAALRYAINSRKPTKKSKKKRPARRIKPKGFSNTERKGGLH